MEPTAHPIHRRHRAAKVVLGAAVASLLTLCPLARAGAAPTSCQTDGGTDPSPFTLGQPKMDVTVNGTYVPVAGLFWGNDNLVDIYWYAAAGTDQGWRSTGREAFDKQAPVRQANGDRIPVVGQFGGSDRDDILWYGPGAAVDELWISNGDGTFTVKQQWVGGNLRPVALRSLGLTDVLWVKAGTSQYQVWDFDRGDGSFSVRTIAGTADSEPVVGDYNGDGAEDVFWYGAGAKPDGLTYGEDYRHPMIPQTVMGTYRPVVVNSRPAGSVPQADILWWSGTSSTMSRWLPTGAGTWMTCVVRAETNSRIVPIPLRFLRMGANTRASLVHLWDPAGIDRSLRLGYYQEDEYVWRYLDNPHPTAGAIPIWYSTYQGSSGWMIWYRPGPGADLVTYPWQIS